MNKLRIRRANTHTAWFYADPPLWFWKDAYSRCMSYIDELRQQAIWDRQSADPSRKNEPA